MIEFALDVLSPRRGRCGAAYRGVYRHHLRYRLIPGAESLEGRDCPSALGAQVGLARHVHSLASIDQGKPQVRHVHQHSDVSHHNHQIALKKSPKGALLTVYVAPNGKNGTRAGRTPSRPLGSLTTAIKRAKSGATIYLAPGVYNQNVAMMGKSNITIVGAADGASILAAGGQALKVYSSSNITIENVSFRSASSGGVGLAVVGSTVNLSNIQTNGTSGDGVLVGQGGVLTAVSSHFDQVRLGSGLELQPGSSATITGCTFNGNGTGANVTTSSNGLRVDTGATASITGSVFDGNTNAGLTAYGNARVTASQSTFSGNRTGDGALIQDQAAVDFTGNTFSSNGVTVGEVSGLNGLEFLQGYSGTAIVSGNKFLSNTANGIYVGSAGQLTISKNQFSGNVVGIFLDGTSGSINATVVGNAIQVSSNSIAPSGWQGIVAAGTGLTATIGGTGADANTLVNYPDFAFIYEAAGGGARAGSPHVTFLANSYFQNGQPVDPSVAIHRA